MPVRTEFLKPDIGTLALTKVRRQDTLPSRLVNMSERSYTIYLGTVEVELSQV